MRQRTIEQLRNIVEKMQELTSERDILVDRSKKARIDGKFVKREVAPERIRVIDRQLGWYRGRVPADMIPAEVNAIFEARKAERAGAEAERAAAAAAGSVDETPASESDTETLKGKDEVCALPTSPRRPPDRFLPGVPGPDIERILDAAPGEGTRDRKFRPTHVLCRARGQRLRLLPPPPRRPPAAAGSRTRRLASALARAGADHPFPVDRRLPSRP